MNKKFISVIMAAILAVSASAYCADAAEVDAEASKESGTFFFDSGDWNSSNICFYIWDATSGEYAEADGWSPDAHWASKKRLGGKAVEGKEGVFESNPIDFSGREDHDICVIFHDTDTNAQTFDCRINASVFGCTAKRNGNKLENPVDSDKTGDEVEFDGGSDVGSALTITSTGHIVGSVAGNVDGTKKVSDFIYKYYGTQDKNTGADVVTKDSVNDAISRFGTNKDAVWAKYQENSTKDDAGEFYKPDDVKKLLEIDDGTTSSETSSTSSDTSSTTSSTSSTTSSSGSTGSTAKSTTTTTTGAAATTTAASTEGGSTDAAATGDTRGVVAFAAVLVAAAGTIVATRKKIED